MKRYNLSEIMKSAHTMRKFRPEKYPTFSEALKKAWKVAKFNKEIADRRAETIAYHEARKQEARNWPPVSLVSNQRPPNVSQWK